MDEEQEKELKAILDAKCVKDYEIHRRGFYEEPVVVFRDCLKIKGNDVSLAFAFAPYPKFSPKFWCTEEKINAGTPHESYKTLSLEPQKIPLYPFSIKMEGYNLENILDLIDTIGQHNEQ